MAHFAELDENNVVLRVYVVHDEDTKNLDGIESEEVGKNFISNIFGGNWIQTSYNSNFRNKFAGIGDIYIEEKDAFIDPSPYPSWIFNEESLLWDSPVPYPTTSGKYKWVEETLEWQEVE